MVMLVTTVCSD